MSQFEEVKFTLVKVRQQPPNNYLGYELIDFVADDEDKTMVLIRVPRVGVTKAKLRALCLEEFTAVKLDPTKDISDYFIAGFRA